MERSQEGVERESVCSLALENIWPRTLLRSGLTRVPLIETMMMTNKILRQRSYEAHCKEPY